MIPIDILTADNQRIVEAVARNRHTQRDYVVAAMFAAAATMLGKRVQTHIESYTNYAQLWVAVVGYTSEAKSPALEFFFAPVFRREAVLAAQYKEAVDNYDALMATRKKDDDEPDKPVYRHRVENNTTDEQVDQAIAQNDAITWYADELPMVFGLMGRYTKNGGSTVAEAKMLAYFGNAYTSTTRLSRTPEITMKPCLSIVGTIQPGRLREIMQGRTQSGLFQRFVFVWPERSDDDIDGYQVTDTESERQTAAAWEREVTRIEHMGETDLMWTADAVEVYRAAKVEWLRQARAYEVNDPDYASIINKMSIHLCRWSVVAAVLAGKVVIDGSVVDYAKRCCDVFADNARKVYEHITGGVRQQQPTLTLGVIYKGLLDRFPGAKKTELAKVLGVTRQSIDSAMNKLARLRDKRG